MARPRHRYLPHRSHLSLEMATRTCLGAGGASGRGVWACFGVARPLKMSVRDPPKQYYLPDWSHLALEMAARACLGAAGVSGRAVWACFGALKMAAQSRQCNHLALEMVAWARPGSGGAPCRAVWTSFGVASALEPEPLGPQNGHLDLPGCCWSVRQGRLNLFQRCPGAQNGRSNPSSAATWPSKLPLRPAQVLVERPAGRLGLFWRCQGAQNGCSEPPVCLKRRFRLLKHCYR